MELEQWKQKYYDQLDHLEKKEEDWEKLETTLKRTIGRLSLAAEGQHATLDRHITELRTAIKNNINRQRLDSVVDDISRVLSGLEEKSAGPNRESICTLEKLINKISLPSSIEKKRQKLIKKFSHSDDTNTDELLKESLSLLVSVIQTETQTDKPGIIDRLFNSGKTTHENHSAETPVSSTTVPETPVNQQLDIYRTCLIELLNNLDNPDSPNGKLSALKIGARDAKQQSELDTLSEQLSTILLNQTQVSNPVSSNIETNTSVDIEPSLQPSIQELLIRLLEQLIVPADLQSAADKMKHRLEKEAEPSDWKKLLKDVALLINSIRSHMQKEKHEFENFLQQVTDRLKAMDHFLQNETSNIQQANTLGKQFDKQMGLNVDEIRLNIDQATELSSLKQTVNSKLDTISGHIQHYREAENSRYQQSQDEVDAMHSKMLTLETEAEQLKKLVIEKNRQAMFDALTGIPSFSNPLSLAIWDIDFFKKVNDTYGHKAGDKVLKTVAQLLVKSIRSTDYLARYGGEEFVMLLPGTRQEETLRLVNKLRLQIENCGFHYHGDAVKITVSCGVSSFNENDTLGQVFERADKALYRAKENGRNQCVVASSLSD